MTDKNRTAKITEILKTTYPLSECALRADNAFELLVAVRLSAQCTDKRVNEVTPKLFERFSSLDAFANAEVAELESYVHSCGFYHAKAADIKAMAAIVRDTYGGIVPDTVEELVKLPGVGRKTANLIVGDIYGKPAIVCDTHVIRITNKIGIVHSKDPLKVENTLRELLDPAESNDFCHRLVLHGRSICTARKPSCSACPIYDLCERNEYSKK